MALEDLISQQLGIPVDIIRSAWCPQTTDVAANPLKSLGTRGDTTKSASCLQPAAANPLKIKKKVPWGHVGTPGTPEKNNTGCKKMTLEDLITRLKVDTEPAFGSVNTDANPLKT